MSIIKKSKRAIIRSLFNRRGDDFPEEEPGVASTLEEIAREVQKEAHLVKDDFFAPTHVLKPEAPPAPRKEKVARHYRLTADQYEKIFESSLTALEEASQIIDRNRAATSKLKNDAGLVGVSSC